MISYNIITGDTLTKVFQRIPGGKMHFKNSEQENVLHRNIAEVFRDQYSMSIWSPTWYFASELLLNIVPFKKLRPICMSGFLSGLFLWWFFLSKSFSNKTYES